VGKQYLANTPGAPICRLVSCKLLNLKGEMANLSHLAVSPEIEAHSLPGVSRPSHTRRS
jgi:hypothetical protein